MKQAFVSAVVAALVSIGAWQLMNARSGAEPVAAAAAPVLRVTEELIEDGWVARAPGADAKPLAHALELDLLSHEDRDQRRPRT